MSIYFGLEVRELWRGLINTRLCSWFCLSYFGYCEVCCCIGYKERKHVQTRGLAHLFLLKVLRTRRLYVKLKNSSVDKTD